jgi:hypothetical protein
MQLLWGLPGCLQGDVKLLEFIAVLLSYYCRKEDVQKTSSKMNVPGA